MTPSAGARSHRASSATRGGSRRLVWFATSHLAESLADAGVGLEAYVVAVDAAASEDWHVLLGRVASGS